MLQQVLKSRTFSPILKSSHKAILLYPKRFEFRRLIKYKSVFQQKFYDHFNRTPDQRGELTNINESDPLFFDERHRPIRGGIDIVCTPYLIYYCSILLI